MGKITNESCTFDGGRPYSYPYSAYSGDDLMWSGEIVMVKIYDQENDRFLLEAQGISPNHRRIRSRMEKIPDGATTTDTLHMFHRLGREVRDMIKVMAAMDVL